MQVVENQSRGVLVYPLIVVADGFYEALLHAGLDLAAQRSQRLDLRSIESLNKCHFWLRESAIT